MTTFHETLDCYGMTENQVEILVRVYGGSIRARLIEQFGRKVEKKLSLSELWRADEEMASSYLKELQYVFANLRHDFSEWLEVFEKICTRFHYFGYAEQRIDLERFWQFLKTDHDLEKVKNSHETPIQTLERLRDVWLDKPQEFKASMNEIVFRMKFDVPNTVSWDQDRNLIRGWSDYNKFGH